ANTPLYTLPLHDALPISERCDRRPGADDGEGMAHGEVDDSRQHSQLYSQQPAPMAPFRISVFSKKAPVVATSSPALTPSRTSARSEEHTSELQSRENLVC